MPFRVPDHINERWLFIAIIVLALLLTSRGTAAMGGAAPHYLAVTDSLLRDFDLELTNQYASDGGYLFNPGPPGAHVRRSPGGEVLPGHEPGLSVLMVPPYAIGLLLTRVVPESVFETLRWNPARFARDLLSWFTALLYACAAIVTLRCVRLLGPVAGGKYGEWAVAIAFLTPPLLSLSLVALPEIPVALLAVWFAATMLGGDRGGRAALALALIPWVGSRYLAISAAGLLWMWRDGRAQAGRATALVVGSTVALGAYSFYLHGSVIAVANLDRGVPLSLGHGLRASLGLLIDPDVGLLVHAPFWGIALAGLATVRSGAPRYVEFAVAAFVGTFAAAAFTQEWWGGYSPAARLLVPVLPLLVPLLGAGMRRLADGWRRVFTAVAVGWACVLSLVLLIEPVSLWADAATGRGLMTPRFAVAWRAAEEPAEGSRLEDGTLPRDPLVVAAQRGNMGPIRTLLADGAPTDATDGDGLTALMYAASQDNARAVRRLINSGAELDARDKDGWSPATYAAHSGATNALEQLTWAGADLDAMTRLGWSPLMLAAHEGRAAVVAQLLAAGVDVNASSHGGMTALIRAAQQGRTEVLLALLAAGADTAARAGGFSAHEWATMLGEHEAAALLAAQETTGDDPQPDPTR